MSAAQIYYTPDLNLPPSDPEPFLDSDPESDFDIDSVMEYVMGFDNSDAPMVDQSGLDSNWNSDAIFGRNQEGMIGEFDPFFAQVFAPSADPNENLISPPASMTVIENLDSVLITQEDVDNDNVACAVCFYDMNVGDIVKQLPCSHHYHGDCIVPWLLRHNTCPVCRSPLPRDDV